MSRSEKLYAWFVSASLAVAVLSPLWREPPRDSFPLSDYPMFSLGRPDPTLVLTHALGVLPDGTRRPLPPRVSAGTFEELQSMMTIGRAAVAGPASRRAFCAEVASRVAGSSDANLADVLSVELATSRFDTLAYFQQGPEPMSRRVHVRCPVPR